MRDGRDRPGSARAAGGREAIPASASMEWRGTLGLKRGSGSAVPADALFLGESSPDRPRHSRLAQRSAAGADATSQGGPRRQPRFDAAPAPARCAAVSRCVRGVGAAAAAAFSSVPILLINYATSATYAVLIVEGTGVSALFVSRMQLFSSSVVGLAFAAASTAPLSIASGDATFSLYYHEWMYQACVASAGPPVRRGSDARAGACGRHGTILTFPPTRGWRPRGQRPSP